MSPQDASRQLKESFKSFSVKPKELPDVNYKTEFDCFEQGIDAVLNRARTLVDNNLKFLEENVRSQLYDIIEIKEDNLTRIEKVEYNGQHSYNLTYSKENTLYPEFYIIQTDKQGNIKDVLKSR